jgi:ABC-type Fe3+ transport system substrate-binding protein
MSSISRRTFLGAAATCATAILSGCGPTAPPTASPGTAIASAGAAASGASGDWQAHWNDLIAAAKNEGTVTVHFGAAGGPAARQVLPPLLKQMFGIDLQVLVLPTAEILTKLKLEQSAGQHTIDVIVSGPNNMYQDMYDGKMFQPLKPQMFHPEATNPADWSMGKMWFMDPEEQYILRIANAAAGWVFVNTNLVKPDELTSWQDLLKPQYKGKIATFDPTIDGQGAQHAVYLDLKFGTDYVKNLYAGQGVQLTRDNGQLADWLGRGNAAIVIGFTSSAFEKLKSDGLPVAVVQPPFADGPGYLAGSSGLIGLLNDPPHPNAAQLFCNWLAMPAGMSVYDKAINQISPLKTVKSDWITDYQTPKPGVDYIDTYDWKYTREIYPVHFDAIRKALGAS